MYIWLRILTFLIIVSLFTCSCSEWRNSTSDESLLLPLVKNSITPPNNLKCFYPSMSLDTSIIEHIFYHLSYNEKKELPNWLIYKLTSQMLEYQHFDRTNDFRVDTAITTGSASLDDYKGSDYDRGHLVPAADMKFSEVAMSETFFLSNVSPQIPSFNRGIWRQLEQKVRSWTLEEDSLIIMVGPVSDSCISWIGLDSVCVPYQFYKIILDISPPDYKGIAFLMRNDNLKGSVFNYSTTIDSVENIIGINFFANVKNINVDSLESTKNDTLWK